VSVALVIQHAMRMRRNIVSCDLCSSTTFFYTVSQMAQFSGKEKLLNVKFVFFIFSTTVV